MNLNNSTQEYETIIAHEYLLTTIAKFEVLNIKGCQHIIDWISFKGLPNAEDDAESNFLLATITFLEEQIKFNNEINGTLDELAF